MKRLTLGLFVIWLLILLAVFPRVASASPIKIAVIGDSGSDEYQADDRRGGAYYTTTFNWLEQAVRNGSVDAGSWGTRSEPRRTGYAYNAARSGSTVSAAIQAGQGSLVKTFNAQVVVISIGTRDMEIAFQSLYSRTLTGTALINWQNGIVTGIKKLALDVSPAPVILLTVPDMSIHPLIISSGFYTNPLGLKYVHDAVTVINDRLTEFALAAGYSIRDVNGFVAAVYSTPGLPFDPLKIGDAPENGLLSDYHPGTRWSCLYANFILNGVAAPLECGFASPVTVTPVSFILTDDYYSVPKNGSVNVYFTDLLANDLGQNLQVVNGAPPLHGSVTPILGGGRYTPTTDFVGTDNFTYTAQDVFGQTKTARVYVEVGP